MKNPALNQEPRYEPAAVIPLKREASLLDWLEASGRLIHRQDQAAVAPVDEEEEFEGLIDEDNYVDEEDTASTAED